MTNKKTIEDLGLIKLSELGPTKFVATGIKQLDEITQFPRGRVTEIYGLNSVGKSTLALTCVANMSHDGKVLYIDSENAINPDRLRALKPKDDNLDISTEYILEKVAELVMENIGKYDAIVVDSIASLLPSVEGAGNTGDQFVGVKAKLINQWMRRMTGRLGKSKTALILINQLRRTIGDMYAPKYYTPGGAAIEYHASLRIELKSRRTTDKLKEGKDIIGQTVTAEITKSKVGRPYLSASFRIMY